MDLKIFKYTIPVTDFIKAPRQEQVFLMEALNRVNEIDMLQKCTIFSVNGGKTSDEVKKIAQNMQALYFIKLQAGALWECFKSIEAGYLNRNQKSDLVDLSRTSLYKSLSDKLTPITEYFKNKDSRIEVVRNTFAYHQDFYRFFKKYTPPEEKYGPYDIFIGERTNSAYLFASRYSLGNLVSMFGASEETAGTVLDEVIEDIKKVYTHMSFFLDGFYGIFARHYLKVKPTHLTEISISDVPAIGGTVLPFFTITPNSNNLTLPK